MGRAVIEGIQPQGAQEAIAYLLLCSPGAVSVSDLKVYDVTSGMQDVTETCMPDGLAGVSLVAGNIQLPALSSLLLDHLYRVEVKYSDGVNTLVPFFRVATER
jgi:hypothetical protein